MMKLQLVPNAVKLFTSLPIGVLSVGIGFLKTKKLVWRIDRGLLPT